MYRVFNMGVGLVLILPEEAAQEALRRVEAYPIGRGVERPGLHWV